MRPLEVRRLGRVPYRHALELQRALVEERKADRVPDVLLLLEHPPVITLGVRGDGGRGHILAATEFLANAGIDVEDAGRGGDVTYHGPGQVVGYPIVDLKPDRCDVHRYVRDLEEVMMRTCADHGIEAHRIPGLTGTWVGGNKIGAIGVKISRWVTSHGFAFNVNTNLEHFKLIVPCGIADHGVTSLAALGCTSASLGTEQDRLAMHFAGVFEREIVGVARVEMPGPTVC